MKCSACGMEFGLTHNCSGLVTSAPAEEATAPSGFAPFYYLGQALRIVRWDDAAIERMSRDTNAIFYGLGVWALTAAVVLLSQFLTQFRVKEGTAAPPLVFGLLVGGAIMLFLTFAQLGLCHLAAKWFFGGTGTYVKIMRPLLLGWIVNSLAIIPIVGMFASAIGWTAVLMLVFEDVEGIRRLQAFGIAIVVNILSLAVLQFVLLS